jgi:amidophosphoribosyltransferase
VAGGSDGPKEACGVFGVRDPQQPVAHLTYLGLFALQHRGQESAGIAPGLDVVGARVIRG